MPTNFPYDLKGFYAIDSNGNVTFLGNDYITSEDTEDTEAEPKKEYDPNEIVDYKVINDTVVIVYFADGTIEKAVCDEDDEYDFNKAIEICVCKKKFGGTKAYNNAIRKAIKQVYKVDAAKNAELEEQERIAHKKVKDEERKAKRKAKKRQEKIDIQAEAFYNAMMKYDETLAFNCDQCIEPNEDNVSSDVNVSEDVNEVIE